MLQSSELRPGHIVEIEGQTVAILNYHHNKTGRGGAVIKVKIKNIQTGAITEYTCRPGDKFKEADVEKHKAVYQYSDGDNFYFMESNTFEQISLPKEDIEAEAFFILENTEVYISYLNGQPLSIELPITVTLEVKETTPEVKGGTVTSQMKPAVMETGLKVTVPPFVNIGDKINIDTRTGEYLERA